MSLFQCVLHLRFVPMVAHVLWRTTVSVASVRLVTTAANANLRWTCVPPARATMAVPAGMMGQTNSTALVL